MTALKRREKAMAIEPIDKPLHPDEFLLRIDLPSEHANKVINDLGLSFAGPNIIGNPLYVADKTIYPSGQFDGELPEFNLSDFYEKFRQREEEDIQAVSHSLPERQVFGNLPEERRTRAVSLEAVRHYAPDFQFVPDPILTDDFLQEAVEVNGEVLTYIKKEERTDEMYWAAAESYPSIYKEMPDHLKTETMHELIVRNNGFNLSLLEEKDRTEHICQVALQSFPELDTMFSYKMIEYIPHSEICLDLLTELGHDIGAYTLLEAMNPKVINSEIALEAVSQDISCVALLPESIKDEKIPVITKQEKEDIKSIAGMPFEDTSWFVQLPEERKTEIVSRSAVSTDAAYLPLVPKEYLNREMYEAALNNNPRSIAMIAPEDRKLDLLIYALRVQAGKVYERQEEILDLYHPAIYKKELYKQIIDASPNNLPLIPKDDRSPELCRRALYNCTSSSEHGIVRHIPYPEVTLDALYMDLFTGKDSPVGAAQLMKNMLPIAIDDKVAEKGVALDGHCIRYVPPQLQTEQLLMEAMKTAGPLIILSHNLKNEVKTPSAYKAASRLDPKNFNFVPEQKTDGIPIYASWKEMYHAAQMKSMSKREAVSYFYHLKPEERTRYVSKAAVDISSDCFSNVPYDSLTENMILKALDADGKNLKYIKSSDITDEMYLAAFNRERWLGNLPVHLIRYDMCLAGVDNNNYNLQFVPGHLMSRELCEHLNKDDLRFMNGCRVINDIPYPDIRLQTLKDNPTITFGAMKILRPEYLDKEIATLAIEQDIRCISVVPEKLAENWPKLTGQEKKDIQMLIDTKCYWSQAYREIPDKRKTECVSFAAVCASAESLSYVPPESMSDRVILSVLDRDGAMLLSVPKERRTEEMYLTAVKNNKGCEAILGELPKNMLTPELCQCAVEASGYNLEFVPEEMKTREMCRTSLYSSADLGYEDCEILQYIPYSEVCLEGLEGYINGIDAKELIDLVHPKAFDSSIAGWFVEQEPQLFKRLPEHLQTEDIAEKAVKSIDRKDLTDLIEDCNKMPKVFQEAVMKEFASNLPPNSTLAEVCLEIEKDNPGFWDEHPNMLPKNVSEECNVFTLNRKLEKVTSDHLSVEDVKTLFEGKPLFVEGIKTPQGVLENQYIQFDKKEKILSVSPNPTQKETTRQDRSPEHKKESKGPETPKAKNNRNRKIKF